MCEAKRFFRERFQEYDREARVCAPLEGLGRALRIAPTTTTSIHSAILSHHINIHTRNRSVPGTAA